LLIVSYLGLIGLFSVLILKIDMNAIGVYGQIWI